MLTDAVFSVGGHKATTWQWRCSLPWRM